MWRQLKESGYTQDGWQLGAALVAYANDKLCDATEAFNFMPEGQLLALEAKFNSSKNNELAMLVRSSIEKRRDLVRLSQAALVDWTNEDVRNRTETK